MSRSDPYDATVLRYSQDGETRYQLITNQQGKSRWTKLVDHQHRYKQAAALEASADDDDDIADAKIAQVLGVFEQQRCAQLDRPDASISPDKIPMMTCGGSGTTHAVLHSSSDSGGDGDAAGSSGSLDSTAASRAKKTVSFAEKVSYHSPTASPHPSPKKTVSCDHISSSAQLQYRYHEHMTRPRDTTAIAALLNNASK